MNTTVGKDDTSWLEWGRALQALAQNGLTYSKDAFDIQRFMEIQRIAAEMVAAGSSMQPAEIHGLFTNQTGYLTPKVDVRAALFRDDRILLVQEIRDHNRWTLPGGWADPGDTPAEAVLREVREEAGFEARAVKLAMLYDRDRRGHPDEFFATYKLFFLCEILSGNQDSIEKRPEYNETGNVDFFAEDALPELSISRVTQQEIHTLFEHHRKPDLPTEFD